MPNHSVKLYLQPSGPEMLKLKWCKNDKNFKMKHSLHKILQILSIIFEISNYERTGLTELLFYTPKKIPVAKQEGIEGTVGNTNLVQILW